jgi:hypothetical protein
MLKEPFFVSTQHFDESIHAVRKALERIDTLAGSDGYTNSFYSMLEAAKQKLNAGMIQPNLLQDILV